MGNWLQTIIHNAGGYSIYRDLIILENMNKHNYERKKVIERLRHSIKKRFN